MQLRFGIAPRFHGLRIRILYRRFGIFLDCLRRTLENVWLPDRDIHRFDGAASISFGFDSEGLGKFHGLLLGNDRGMH